MNRFMSIFKSHKSKEVDDHNSASEDSSFDNRPGFGDLDWLRDESEIDFLGTSDYGETMSKRY